MRTLFKNGIILSGSEVINNGFLSVDGKYIDYVGKTRPAGDFGAEKDMSGKLLIPGLVNAHGHSPMTLLRGRGSGLPLQRWLNEAIFPIEAKMTPEDIASGAELAMLEMLACGTTTFSEMYDFPWAEVPVIERAGMKCNIGRLLLCFDPDMSADDCERLAEVLDFARTYDGAADGRIRADYSVHSEYLSTENAIRGLVERADVAGARVNVHMSETAKEQEECRWRHGGMTPAAYFLETGLFSFPTYAAHCVHVTEDDLDIMRDHGVSMVHCPSSNMKLASGFAPVPKALAMGINVALGTDGCASNDNLNMFEEMHLAALIHKGLSLDPTTLSAMDILNMATVNGARALGRDDTGVLKAGMKADIAAIDLDAPHLTPYSDIPSLLVYSAQGSDVCMTMVDGRILYENGEYLTIDAEKVKSEAATRAKALGM